VGVGAALRRAAVVLMAVAALLAATAAAGASAAQGPQALWQRCDGGAEDVSCVFPRGIGVNPVNGNLYLADQFNNRIVEFTAWGEFVRAFGWGVANGSAEAQICTVAANCKAGIQGGGAGQFGVSEGVAVDTSGNVYVFDVIEKRVQKFDSEGHFLLMFGGNVNKTKSEEGGSTEAQRNLCTAGSGDVCQAGTLGAGKGQFNVSSATSAVVVGPAAANRLYIGDKGRIQVFDTEGHYLEDILNPEGFLTGATVESLAPGPPTLSSVDTLYMARESKANVLRISVATGKKVGGECAVSKPTALAMATNSEGAPVGNLYVYDEASGQGRQFGTANTIACPDKEAPFGKGDVTSSTGIAASTACFNSSANADVYLSNSNFSGAFIRAYGPAPDKTACTKPLFAPEIVNQYALSITTSEARLQAQINPRFYADTTYQVRYATAACIEAEGWSASCVKKEPTSPASLGAPAFDFPFTSAEVFLSGLQPATAYRYRFVAQSLGGGPTEGAEHAFTTFALPEGGQPCANADLRLGASGLLPDCRAYEMVSPVDKEGADILVQTDAAGRPAQRNQSAESGDRLTFSAFRAFGEAQGAPFTSQYIAERGKDGWSSENISPPRGIGFNGVIAGGFSEFQLFTPDLCSAWIDHYSGTAAPLAAGAAPLNQNLYRRSDCGAGAGGYETLSKIVGGAEIAPVKGLSADGGVAIFRDRGHLSQEVATRASATEKLLCESPTPVKTKSPAFQWLRDGSPIGGATAAQYSVNPAQDAGHTIQCRLTVSEGGAGSTGVATPAWVIEPYPATPPPLAPAQIATPTSSGPLTVGGPGGQTLSCDPGSWEGASSFAYQWYRNGAPLAGATNPQYTVQPADLASAAFFQCEVSGEDGEVAGGTVVETSEVLATDPAPAAPIARPNMASENLALYAAYGAGQLRAVCVLPGGTQSRGCAAGTGSKFVLEGRRDQVIGALSADGSRAFWTNSPQGTGRIYLRENPTEAQSALAHGQAVGAGERSLGSNEVKALSTASGAFAVGQTISGEGIPFGTTIEAVGAGTLTLSANATKSTASTAPLAATSECTEAQKACTVGVSESVEEPENSSRFWAASADGSRALFTSGPPGVEHPTSLYEFDTASATTTPIADEVFGVLGQSKDLSRIYFVSTEKLTGAEENSEGAVAQTGQPNLYLRREGSLSFVATLAAADALYETNRRLSPVDIEPYLHGARVSGDGESAAFISTAQLTSYDNTDIASGQADAEVFLYDARAGKLMCASCDPGGARPVGRNLVINQGGGSSGEQYWGAAILPYIGNELYFSHFLSEDGKRLFFHSFGPLTRGDTNGVQDVYEWEALGSGSCTESVPAFSPQNEGCVSLISTGESPQDSELLDASPDGRDVFIKTGSSLVAQDPGQFDVYDARVEGGFPPPPGPIPPCEGEACQSPPPPPAELTPSSSIFQGAENPAKPKQVRCAKNKRRVVRQGKARCVKKKSHQRRAQRHNGRAAR
jgi:hypothetical protein